MIRFFPSTIRQVQGGGIDYSTFEVIYSIARLVNPSYGGSLIRIRRDSDGTEQDIGVVGTDLDTAAIDSFCTGTIGRIQRVYNQGTLGTTWDVNYYIGTRSIIYQSGAVELVNGKPAMVGQTGNGYRTGVLPIADSLWIQNHVVSAIIQTQSTVTVQIVIGEMGNGTGNQRKGIQSDTTTARGLIDNANTTFGGAQTHLLLVQATTSQQRQYSHLKYDVAFDTNNSKSYWNGNLQQNRQSTVTWVGNTTFQFNLMRPALIFLGKFQEYAFSTIVGATDNDTLLRALEAEQNAYYGIY